MVPAARKLSESWVERMTRGDSASERIETCSVSFRLEYGPAAPVPAIVATGKQNANVNRVSILY